MSEQPDRKALAKAAYIGWHKTDSALTISHAEDAADAVIAELSRQGFVAMRRRDVIDACRRWFEYWADAARAAAPPAATSEEGT